MSDIDRCLDARTGDGEALAVGCGEWFAGKGRARCGGDDGDLETDATQYIHRGVWSALASCVLDWLREQVGQSEADRGEDIPGRAAGEVMKEYTSIIEFADRQRWVTVLVRGAARDPSADPSLPNALEARQ